MFDQIQVNNLRNFLIWKKKNIIKCKWVSRRKKKYLKHILKIMYKNSTQFVIKHMPIIQVSVSSLIKQITDFGKVIRWYSVKNMKNLLKTT